VSPLFGGLSVQGMVLGAPPVALDMPPLLESELPPAPGFELPAVPTSPGAPEEALDEPAVSAPLPAFALAFAPPESSGDSPTPPLSQADSSNALSST